VIITFVFPLTITDRMCGNCNLAQTDKKEVGIQFFCQDERDCQAATVHDSQAYSNSNLFYLYWL